MLLYLCRHLILNRMKPLIYNIYNIGMQPSSYRIRYIRINSQQIFKQYQNRVKDPIPNTPLIQIGQQNGQLTTLFVEELDQKNIFEQLKENTLEYKLFFLHQIIFAFIKLREKFGCFRIDQSFFKMNQNNQPRVWFHREPISMNRQFPLPDSPSSELIMVAELIFNLDNLERCDTLKELLRGVSTMINKMSCIPSSAKQDLESSEKKQIGNFLREKFRRHRQSNYIPNQRPNTKSFYLTDSINSLKKSSLLKGSNYTSHGQNQGKNKTITDPKSIEIEAKKLIQKNKQYSKPYRQEHHSNFKAPKNLDQIRVSNVQLKSSPFPRFRPKCSEIISYNQVIPGSMIAQQTKQDQEQKQRVFQRSKFPYSTESTFVTLKQTKSFGQIPPYFQTEIQAIPIEEQKSSQNKASSNERSQNALAQSQPDLQNDFESLFMDDEPQRGEQINQEEYAQREQQFSQILFS